ncbi:MAG: hypothetical protein NVS9B4_25100 [Candidatus Acidiferrum sp.]
MRKVYYNSARNSGYAALIFFTTFLTSATCPQQPALKAASLESHEGFTISVRPWISAEQYKEKFPKKSPFSVGIVAVQVSFRNDSEQALKVDLERIRLSFRMDEETRQLQPLNPDQVADGVLKPGAKDPRAPRVKLPIPGRVPNTGHDKQWAELEKQAQDASVPGPVVAPHSTLQGLMYFDLQGQYDLLNSAHLYVPDIAIVGKDHSLTYFEIDLSRALN